jgi:hypothetical protein
MKIDWTNCGAKKDGEGAVKGTNRRIYVCTGIENVRHLEMAEDTGLKSMESMSPLMSTRVAAEIASLHTKLTEGLRD